MLFYIVEGFTPYPQVGLLGLVKGQKFDAQNHFAIPLSKIAI